MRIEYDSSDEPAITIESIAKCKNQQEAAFHYAFLLRFIPRGKWDKFPWKDVNAAVQARWPKGLTRVKDMAWKIALKKESEPR